MRGDPIPDTDHIARHCRYHDLVYDAGQLIGINELAFLPRPGEDDGLSANWLEFFSRPLRLPYHIACARSITKLRARDSNRIAVLAVRTLKISAAPDAILTIVEDPDEDLPPSANAAHAIIRPADELRQNKRLRQRLASTVRPTDIFSYR
jgi:hypothetical protein